MKYETPEINALKPAINAIQDVNSKTPQGEHDGPIDRELASAYQDWEE
jgi:hypothetical protein